MITARRVGCALSLVLFAKLTVAQDVGPSWIDPGRKIALPAVARFPDFYGTLGVLHASGSIDTNGHPFFTPLGSNGRACVSCHQPAYAMSVSAVGLRERWNASAGTDPVFAAIDGSNCPHLPQDQSVSHSLLLERGLFRVSMKWPPQDFEGHPIESEFELEVVRDPTGCNLHPEYGLRSKQPMVSVYRRPRPVANLKYVMATQNAHALLRKNGSSASIDPDSKLPQSMNLLADARWPTLKLQLEDAARVHLQRSAPLSANQIEQLMDFQLQVYAAQIADRNGGTLLESSAPEALGPEQLAHGNAGEVGDSLAKPVFGGFGSWKGGGADARREFRAAVARGNEIFLTRAFWIRDAMHTNSLYGNPTKRTCAACHTARLSGMDTQAGWIDVGTSNLPWASESPELPLFKITCNAKLPPHPFLGRSIYTHDPGRALVSGKCEDVGAIVMQQLRGLAGRPPYFANGSARTLREAVDYYDRRFNIRFSEQEKQDLVSFLSVL